LGIQGNETGLLGEAIFMMNMERNADLKPLMADRPLMRNWDYVEGKMYPLLYHTNSQSFKTFNYYISKLFRDNLIDEYYQSAFYSGKKEQQLNENYLFSSVGKDTESNELVIKIVNISDEPISSKLQIGQLNTTVAAKVTTLVSQKGVRNTPERPNAVIPLVENIDLNLQNDYIFKPKSLTVIRINVSHK
jgi:alpha-L-arabinofuranosidase